MKKSIISLSLFASISFIACGDSNNNDDSITHNNISYKEVKSTTTNRIWLDRNLGASQVCNDINDTLCFGDLYQWGRQTDGHEKRTSNTISSESNSISTAGNKFITTNGQWTDNSTDVNGSQRQTINWSNTNGNSVCPSSFRVPTIDEIKAETFDISINTNTETFNSFLKLPSAGYREVNGTITRVGLETALWSNTISTSDTNQSHEAKYISTDDNNSFATFRAYGNSIRCIKEN